MLINAVGATQCPTCGKTAQDWASPASRITDENGTKARLIVQQDRMEPYRAWRYKIGQGCVATDVDQVEWRNGVPVAVLEVTMVDRGAIPPPPSYLNAVLARKDRDKENDRLDIVAKRLGVPGFVVCFMSDLKDFYVVRISPSRTDWVHMSVDAYSSFIRGLAPGG